MAASTLEIDHFAHHADADTHPDAAAEKHEVSEALRE
jgi:hypothetical protein